MAAVNPSKREAEALAEIAATEIAAPTRAILMAVFILGLLAFPIAQWRFERTSTNADPRPPITTALPTFWQQTEAPRAGLFGQNDRALRALSLYESRLQRDSFAARNWIPPIQAFTLKHFGLGNEQAYPGRDGWAFYRPAVEHLTGPGFLGPKQLARRAAGGNAWEAAPHPDPRPAILELRNFLESQGRHLLLLPAAAKAAVYPEMLGGIPKSGKEEQRSALRNQGEIDFHRWCNDNQVYIEDTAEVLRAVGQTGTNSFLKSDTHWSFHGMDQLAQGLTLLRLPDYNIGRNANSTYTRTPRIVRSRGDIADTLLQLGGRDVFPYEEQTIQVVSPDPSEGPARILLLGDSYSNIFRMEELGWGSGAGLPEQIAYHLGEPVLAFTRNDGGAHASRQLLADALRRKDPRLAHIKLVIWEFAARELSFGDWKPMEYTPFPTAEDLPKTPVRPTETNATAVTGTITAVSRPPIPGTVPYRDCLIQAVIDVDGEERLLHVFGMRDNKHTPAAQWTAGQSLTILMTPWEDVASLKKLDGFNVEALADPDDVYLFLDPYWTDLKDLP